MVRAAGGGRLGRDGGGGGGRRGGAAGWPAVTGNLKVRRSRVLVPLINSYYARLLAAKRIRRETAKKAPIAHYPAPHALIDLWQKNGGNPQDMQRGEIASVARLLVTDTCRNLLPAFFLRDHLTPLAHRARP